VTRYTFLVQVHVGGISTLENLGTRERIQVTDVATVGAQIEEWLAELGEPDDETHHRRGGR